MSSKNMVRESYRKVLCCIAENGETTKFNLKNSTNLTYAPIHAAVEQLLKWGLIEETRREQGPGPIPKRFFGLTLKGLAYSFRWSNENPSKCIDKTARKWSDLLPLVFGKWEYFVAEGLENEAILAIRWVTNYIIDNGNVSREQAVWSFGDYIMMLTWGSVRVMWLKALRGDQELRAWARNELEDRLIEGREFLRANEASLKALEVTEEPDWNQVAGELRFHYRKKVTQEEMLDQLKM